MNVQSMLAKQAKYMEKIPSVMLHGDTWTNNIFFCKKNPENCQILAFIDWQISFAGCGLNDLSRFSMLCVDSVLRREHQKEIVQRYFDR